VPREVPSADFTTTGYAHPQADVNDVSATGRVGVDRVAPVVHHTMRAARAKPQVSDPDEFSAPTGFALPRYGDAFRVTEDNLHFSGPLALRVPLACQVAVVPESTLATEVKPSPTPLPAESVNFTWIV
jgi:hypothetical protein